MRIRSVGTGEFFSGGQKVADVLVTAELKGNQCGEGTVHLGIRNRSDVYVTSALYDEITSRPDWPEIEKRMKEIYGENWRIVCVKGGGFLGGSV